MHGKGAHNLRLLNEQTEFNCLVNNSHAVWTSVVHIMCAVIRGLYMDLVSPVTIQVSV